jgi:hypothetical protein
MAIASTIFEKCLPAIGSSINSCGALTECDIVTATPDELEEIFQSNGDFRDMSSLLVTQFEIKACGAKQNGLYDFLMANAKPMKNRTIKTPLGFGNSEIAPFIMAETMSVINDKYWSIKDSSTSEGTITFNLQSPGNVDLDLSWFPDDIRVFAFGTSAAGSAIRASYKVTGASLSTYNGSPSIAVDVVSQNAGSFLPAAKTETPTTGFLVLGTPNVADVERWCENRPALNGRKHVPFWFETTRWTMCVDELYERAFARLRQNNDYFRLFGDIEVAQRNKQYAERFQRDWVNQVFWGKASNANQTLANYRSLPTISSATSNVFDLNTEGKCVGRKADVIGIYEQLAQCNRVADLQGQTLNLEEFFNNVIYPIVRSRGDQGKPNQIIEVITDSFYASLFQRGMIRYFNEQSEGLARFMIDTKKIMTGQKGELGFSFDTYHLIYPQGVELRVLTHPFFDDFVTQAKDNGVETSGRMLWILDWSGIYPGIIGYNRVVHRTGAIEDLAKIDASYACVMANPTAELSLNSITYTVIVECPSDSIVIEGVAANIPVATGATSDPSAYDYYTDNDSPYVV